MYNKTIYKKDNNNRIRFLEIITDNDKLLQMSGIINTNNPIIHSKICKAKNVGKSNETSADNQAIKEAEALYKDKLTKGYFNSIAEAESEEVILPMLAKDYKKESHKIDYNDIINSQVFVQPKLDGMRCLAHINRESSRFGTNYSVVLKSRDGKIIENMMHIENDLLKLAVSLNQSIFPHIFDGELYVHGEDFQTNMECIKKYRKRETEKIQFHIYDKININEEYQNRRSGLYFIEGLAKGFELTSLNFVHSNQVTSEEMMKEAHQAYLQLGYEGTMIRLGRGLYKVNGRSSDLLKYKDFQDIDCKIIEIGPAERRPEWGRPVVEYNGKRFACGTKMSHEARKELLTNKENYIGKISNIRFFEYSNTGIPRFPVMVGIHEDR